MRFLLYILIYSSVALHFSFANEVSCHNILNTENEKKWSFPISFNLGSLFKNKPRIEWRNSDFIYTDKNNVSFFIGNREHVMFEIAFWSKYGNPVIRINPKSVHKKIVRFRPSQPTLTRWNRNVTSGKNVTSITKRQPILTSFHPNQEEPLPNIIVSDGHHRLVYSLRSEQDVYVEIANIREPFDWEIREGKWKSSSSLF